jgi:hypothetical protein
MVKRICSLFLILTACLIHHAQTISGKVIDQRNKQAVPFAFVGINNTNLGTTTDIDGHFTLQVNSGVSLLVVQIVSYEKAEIDLSTVDLTKPLLIKLKSSDITLAEVVVTPKENPANEIIRRVIKNKEHLDPRNLPFYSCETYGKTYFTASTTKGDEFYYNEDTVRFRKDKAFLDENYLFLIESASEKKYLYKNINQEKILASRVSGFKAAPFASLASQLQSFTFFDRNISVIDIKYVNPLQKGTFKRYRFDIRDTIIEGTDTTILIDFKPRKNVNFKALKGTLYINKNDYAIASVMAEPESEEGKSNAVKIQQLYKRVNGKQWFPVQLVTEILFNNAKVNAGNDKSIERIMKCVSRLYVTDVNLDSTIKIKKKNVEVINDKGYEKKDEDYWKTKRNDSLSEKEKRTYSLLDSIGKAENFDRKLKLFKILSTGQIPIGVVSLDIRKILKANDYEKIRVGAGLLTNDKLTRWGSMGAYAGYGFGDKAWKYGGFAQINFTGNKSTNIRFDLARDLFETAHTDFLEDNVSIVSTQNIRNYLVGMMDFVSYGKVSLNTPINHFIKSSFYFQTAQRTSRSGFGTLGNYYSDDTHTFITNEAGVQIKLWPFEKFSESFLGLISLGSKWPCFYVNYSQTVPASVMGYANTVTFSKLDMRMDHRIYFKIRGYFNYQLQAGKVFGDVPYSFQYNNTGSRINKYYISAENSFETMFFNEFASTEYAAIYTTYNTGKLFKPNKYINPEFEFVNSAGIGHLLNPEKLTNIPVGDISKVYTETGLRAKNLLQSGFSSFGVGLFYRYGAYAFPDQKNNLVFKFVLGFTF